MVALIFGTLAFVILLTAGITAGNALKPKTTDEMIAIACESDNAEHREQAATELAQMLDPQVTSRVVANVDSGSANASASLGMMKGIYLKALDDQDPDQRLASIGCLQAAGGDSSFDAIIRLLSDDGEAKVRAGALEALVELGERMSDQETAAVIDAISESVEDDQDPDMRKKSMAAFDDLWQQMNDDQQNRAELVLTNATLKDEDAGVRQQSIAELNTLWNKLKDAQKTHAQGVLWGVMLADPDKSVRMRAVQASPMNSPGSISYLVAALSKESDPGVSQAIQTVLLSFKHEQIIQPLIDERAKTKDPTSAQRLVDFISKKVGDAAVQPLVNLIGPPQNVWMEDVLVQIGWSDSASRAGTGVIPDSSTTEMALAEKMKTGDDAARWSALATYARIRKADAGLTAVLSNRNLKGVADNYAMYIKWGIPGSQWVLVRALENYGNETMTVDYLNCGDDQLDKAGENWANSHGYSVYSERAFGSTGPQWGSSY
jgi:HEAT repeat protein